MSERPPSAVRRRSGGMVSLGSPFGVRIRVSVIGVGLAIFFAATSLSAWAHQAGASDRETALLAVVGGLLFELCVLGHEIAHCLTAKGLGLTVGGILLFPLGGLTEIESETRSPAREYLISIAGPAASIIFGAVAGAAWLELRDPAGDALGFGGSHGLLAGLLGWLAWANAALAAFNLVPGLPLDGGRVLAAAVWKVSGRRALGTRVAAIAGFVVAAGVLVYSFAGDRETAGLSFYGMLLAVYLALNARIALRNAGLAERTPALSAARLARRALLAAGDLPLAEALRRATSAGARAVVVIERDGRPAALMNGRAVDAMPESRRPWVPLSSVSRPLGPGLVLDAGLSGEGVLDALRATPATEYLVVGPGGDVVGVLAAVDVAAALDRPARAAR